MHLSVSAFITSEMKSNGSHYIECEDRYAISKENFAFAVADGVGDSVYPEFFAQFLVTGFVNSPTDFFDIDNNSIESRHEISIEAYDEYVHNRLSKIEEEYKAKLKKIKYDKKDGKYLARSTFVGCYMMEVSGRIYCNYFGLGDSYMFFVGANGNLHSYSSMLGKSFSTGPDNFSVKKDTKGEIIHGNFEAEDGTLLLMTDAISAWFIREYKENPLILKTLLNLKNQDEYLAFIENARNNGLRGDDTTLVIVQMSKANEKGLGMDVIQADDIEELIYNEKLRIKKGEVLNLKNENENVNKIITELDSHIKQKKIELKQLEDDMSIKQAHLMKLIEALAKKSGELEELEAIKESSKKKVN